MKKKLDSDNTRMLRAILNKSWRQHNSSCTATYHPSKLDELDMRDTAGKVGSNS